MGGNGQTQCEVLASSRRERRYFVIIYHVARRQRRRDTTHTLVSGAFSKGEGASLRVFAFLCLRLEGLGLVFGRRLVFVFNIHLKLVLGA